MKYLTVEIPEKTGYIIPIGDIHLGDKAFTKKSEAKLKGYLDWVKARPNARIFINGDLFNVAGRNTATSPFGQDTDEYRRALKLFEPYKEQIIGCTDGNHEARMIEAFGVSPMQLFCVALNIPYCEWSVIVRVKVGKRNDPEYNRFEQNYFLYFHHTTGGGSTVGSKLNRVAKLREIVEGVDIYCGSHNHQLAVAPQDVYYPNMQGSRAEKRRIWYVDCGSYLEWNDSYAEKMMLAPTKLGSPRIRLDSGKHDVSVSI